MSLRKYIIYHGQCLVALFLAGLILTPVFLYKLYQIKKNNTELHWAKDDHERRIKELEGR